MRPYAAASLERSSPAQPLLGPNTHLQPRDLVSFTVVARLPKVALLIIRLRKTLLLPPISFPDAYYFQAYIVIVLKADSSSGSRPHIMLTLDSQPRKCGSHHFAHHASFGHGSFVYSASCFATFLYLWDGADTFNGDTSRIFMELISA